MTCSFFKCSFIVIYGYQNKDISLGGSKDRRFGLRKRKKEGKVWL